MIHRFAIYTNGFKYYRLAFTCLIQYLFMYAQKLDFKFECESNYNDINV